MLLWGYSFIRAIPCITETTFKYQILPIRFFLSYRRGEHSTVFSTGQGDLSRQTDGTWEKVWIRYKCRNGNPPGSFLLILAPTFMVCLVPYSVWIMSRLTDWLCKAVNTKCVLFYVVTLRLSSYCFSLHMLIRICFTKECWPLMLFFYSEKSELYLIVAWSYADLPYNKMQLCSETIKERCSISLSLEEY